jgi:hypothetical protein
LLRNREHEVLFYDSLVPQFGTAATAEPGN